MKKKIYAVMLIFVMMLTSTIHTYALESGVKSFSISPIEADQKYKHIYVTVEIPKTQKNSKLMIAFYTQGTLTRLTALDASSATKFTNKKIDTYVLVKDPAGNYYKDQTPDQITIYTWNQKNLAPKTVAEDVLTKDVKYAANAEVVANLQIVLEATEHIRSNCLVWEEDYLDGLEDSWDSHLFPVMDLIDECARGAIRDAGNHLVTSLYAQNKYRQEISDIRSLLNTAPQEQKQKLIDLLNPTALGKEYYNALTNATQFLDFSLTEI